MSLNFVIEERAINILV